MAISKSEGSTPSERFLAKQCDQTFLGFWSYPNTQRDQYGGKEICDLVVVCGDHIILFSDKSCAFPDTGDLKLDWSRWYRKAVAESAHQLVGAERWLKVHPNRVFLDKKCTQPIPVSLERVASSHFHRIIVALGAQERCKRVRGGSGSLVLAPSVVGKAHHDIKKYDVQPFMVGSVGADPGQFHVLDDFTLPLLLEHLDTITDFVSYLQFKERLFRSNKVGSIAGEENLLAVFLSEYALTGEWQKQVDKAKDGGLLCIRDGTWNQFTKTDSYKQSREIARESRFWDGIIQEFARHAFAGTLVAGSPETVAGNEEILRAMAEEPRIARLFLTALMLHRGTQDATGKVNYCIVASPTHSDTLYVFVFVSNSFDTEAEYRKVRQSYLEDYCFLVASKHRDCRRVFGIATDAGDVLYRTFEIVTFQAEKWTPEMESLAAEVQAELGVSGDGHVHRLGNDNRPSCAPRQPAKSTRRQTPRGGERIRRNDPCPCGSGKKFKRCCIPRLRS